MRKAGRDLCLIMYVPSEGKIMIVCHKTPQTNKTKNAGDNSCWVELVFTEPAWLPRYHPTLPRVDVPDRRITTWC